MTTPEPVASPAEDFALISTIAGATAAATPETVPALLCETVVPLTTPPEAEPAVPPSVSSPRRVAVPPPTAAAAMATAASRAKGRLTRRSGAGAGAGSGAGQSGAPAFCCAGSYAGGGG